LHFCIQSENARHLEGKVRLGKAFARRHAVRNLKSHAFISLAYSYVCT